MLLNLSIGEYYMLSRKRLQMKLKEVAKYVGCSISLLAQFERGEKELSENKLNLYTHYIDNEGQV